MISVLSNSAKLIFESDAVASMMASTMSNTGVPYAVQKVTAGFQVCPIKVEKSAMPPAKPKPVTAVSAFGGKMDPGNTPFVMAVVPLVNVSNAYFGVTIPHLPPSSKVGQPNKYVGKASLISYEVKGDTIALKMPVKYAKKLGF